jgi:hypothetical protein
MRRLRPNCGSLGQLRLDMPSAIGMTELRAVHTKTGLLGGKSQLDPTA